MARQDGPVVKQGWLEDKQAMIDRTKPKKKTTKKKTTAKKTTKKDS